MTETSLIIPKLRLAAQELGGALWRNNSGAFQNPAGRFVRFGLGNDSAGQSERWKSADLIGVTPCVAGYAVGVFWAVEAKREDWIWRGTKRETAQAAFLQNVKQLGGAAGFARNMSDLVGILLAWEQHAGVRLSLPPHVRS